MQDIPALVQELRTMFDEGRTRSIEWRRAQLLGLRRFLDERASDIEHAVHEDLGKPHLEGYAVEVAYTNSELDHMLTNLARYMRPERVSTPMLAQPGWSRVVKEPLGVVLIIAPWNYPFQLAIGPLIGALAAGNCAVVKPSEVAPATSALIARWLPRYVDAQAVRVVEGGVPETTALLEQRFDHIFFTGSTVVGKAVMAAAAKNLTPVTLELGGKSPCIVDQHIDLEVTARRIVWGKFYNAGQTCVAPDYLLVHEAVHDELVRQMGVTLKEFYGDDPKKSPDYGRIVNERHLNRLLRLMGSGKVVVGGQWDEGERYLAPTILDNVSKDSPAMTEEVFGPILPIVTVKSVDEAIAFVNSRPKPLALYVFSSNTDIHQRVVERTSSGAITINHAWLHASVPGLPFGGVGESGMGAYHGKNTFDTFTHRKGVLTKPTAVDPSLIYPPYDDAKAKWIRRLL